MYLQAGSNEALNQSDYDNVNVPAVYDELSEAYETYVRNDDGRQRCVEWVVSHLSENKVDHGRCIDLGCASGVPVVAALAAAGHEVSGVDLSPEQIRLAQSKVPNAKFAVADMRTWQPPNEILGHIDAVTSFYSFPHLSLADCKSMLTKVNEWLRTDGILALGMVEGVNGRVKWMGFDICGMSMSLGEMCILLKKHGFEVLKSWDEEWSSITRRDTRSKINQFFLARKTDQQ